VGEEDAHGAGGVNPWLKLRVEASKPHDEDSAFGGQARTGTSLMDVVYLTSLRVHRTKAPLHSDLLLNKGVVEPDLFTKENTSS